MKQRKNKMIEDKINPKHYKNNNGTDLLDVLYIEKGIEYIRNVCHFNIRKYTCRAERKNGQEDLDKAKQYSIRLEKFELLENNK